MNPKNKNGDFEGVNVGIHILYMEHIEQIYHYVNGILHFISPRLGWFAGLFLLWEHLVMVSLLCPFSDFYVWENLEGGAPVREC